MNSALSKLPALIRILPGFVQRRIAGRPNLIKVLDNIGWLFFDKILRMGVGLIVGVWVARYLGPEQFGLFNYSVAFVGLFGVVAGLGLQSIVVRDIVRNPLGKAETIGSAAALQFVSGLIAYGLTLISIFWLRPDDALAKTLVAILGSIMLVKVSDVAVYWFESQVQSKFIVWVQNSVFLVFAALKVFFILQNASIFSFVWAAMAEAVIVAVLMLVMLSLRGPHFHELRVSISRVRILLIDSWPLFLSGIAVTVYMKIDQIMIGQILNDQAVGIYSAAVRISELWYFIPMAIVASVFPSILEAKRLSEDIYYMRLQRLYDLMVWLSICVAVPMTFLSSWLVTLLFGEAYEAAGTVLAVHIWAAVFVFLGVASGQWFLSENRQMLSLQRTVLGAVVNVILNILLIPRYEILGAALATVIAQLFAALLFDLVQKETRQMFVMKFRSLNVFSAMMRYLLFRWGG
jgi:PST family polysaccharide transporter